MQKIKKYLYYSINCLIIAIILFCSLNFNKVYAYEVSKGEFVLELNSGKVFSSYNESEILPMASTTKILTAITVINNFDLNKTVKVPKNCVGIEGSSIYLKEGERLTVKELLYGLMLRSGNDCAECLASTIISRSEFIKLMNETAVKCGATNSNFTNPHGLHDDNHYTTAKDLAYITAYAMKNEIFKEIVSTKKIAISNEFYDYKRILINKNKMLFNFDGANGVKTGYTKKAGRCLVSSAIKNGMEVICVVLNSPNMWERSKELINYCFDNYKMTQVLNKENLNNEIFTSDDGKRFTINIQSDFNYPLTKEEIESVNYKINGKSLKEFLKKPDKSGVFEIFTQNKLIFSQNIFTIYID